MLSDIREEGATRKTHCIVHPTLTGWLYGMVWLVRIHRPASTYRRARSCQPQPSQAQPGPASMCLSTGKDADRRARGREGGEREDDPTHGKLQHMQASTHTNAMSTIELFGVVLLLCKQEKESVEK